MLVFSTIPIFVFLAFRSHPSPVIVGLAGVVSLLVLATFHGWVEESYAHVPVQVVAGTLGMILAYYVGVWSDRALKR